MYRGWPDERVRWAARNRPRVAPGQAPHSLLGLRRGRGRLVDALPLLDGTGGLAGAFPYSPVQSEESEIRLISRLVGALPLLG